MHKYVDHQFKTRELIFDVRSNQQFERKLGSEREPAAAARTTSFPEFLVVRTNLVL